jgi:hypothetical protein
MTGSRLFLNVREKLLHPNSTTEQSLSTFQMRPYGPSIEIPDLDCLAATMRNKIEPDSATTLVGERAPWDEDLDGGRAELLGALKIQQNIK